MLENYQLHPFIPSQFKIHGSKVQLLTFQSGHISPLLEKKKKRKRIKYPPMIGSIQSN